MATLKQQKWLKEYIETGNATEAAVRSYDVGSRKAASVIGTENLVKLSKPIAELCDELGLTDELIVNALKEDIVAKKGNRKAELELAAKLKGRMTEKQDIKLDVVKPIYGGLSVQEHDSNQEDIQPQQED